MILSNNAFNFFPINKNTIKRVNIAWIKSKEELIDIVLSSEHKIFYDYPYKRTKLPMPIFDVVEAINIANKLKSKLWCFAISNAEDSIFLTTIRTLLDKEIKIIPKIESPLGIENLKEIMNACETDTLMLDQEDLSGKVDNNITKLNQQLNTLKQKAKANKYKILTLQGVVFDYVKF